MLPMLTLILSFQSNDQSSKFYLLSHVDVLIHKTWSQSIERRVSKRQLLNCDKYIHFNIFSGSPLQPRILSIKVITDTHKKRMQKKCNTYYNKSRPGMFRVISCLKGISKLFMLCTCGSSHHLLFKSFLLTMATSGLNFSIF